MATNSVKNYVGIDPADFAEALTGLGIFATVTYASATQTIGTVPANSIIREVLIVRTTAWDTITTFEVGKSGDTDWLATTVQANVDGAISAGEAGDVERLTANKVVTSATDIILTLNQGAASQGAGYVAVLYTEVNR